MISQADCKSERVYTRFAFLCIKMQEIAADAHNYAKSIGVGHPVITETVTTEEEDKALNRVSDTHRTCRAVDLRVSDWSGEQIDAMIEYLTNKYGSLGAVNSKGEAVVVLYHDNGHGPHFHIQLNRTFSIHNPLEV